MAVRKIFVRPGDRVEVYVINDPEFALNKCEWDMHSPHPFMFSFRADRHGVTFHDPGLDIGVQMSSTAPRYHMEPNAQGTKLKPLGSTAGLGYCPCCRQNRESLPAPAEGTCAHCFNNLMRECKCTFAQRMVGDGCESCNPSYYDDHAA